MASLRLLPVFCLCLLGYALSAAEPACSKFHYEEKMLEKMVRVQFEVEQFSKKLQAIDARMNAELADIRKEVTTYRQETRDTLSQATVNLQTVRKNVTEYFAHIKGQIGTPLVTFRARDPANMSPTSGLTMVYQTLEDSRGGGYSSETGVFTAPIAGLYMFILNVCTKINDHIFLVFEHNGNFIGGTVLKDEKFYYCSPLVEYALMSKGDILSVVCRETGHLLEHYGVYSRWNSFSGVLIHTV